ncbi:MAG: NTP transferase domain-containing protein [Spirosomataceae bacterium]
MKGLILIGGRSTRMGQDKSLLDYHGKTQREYLCELLKRYCTEVYFSCRADQSEQISKSKIIDYQEIGPIGGILSAFDFDDTTDWLIVACDMPLVNEGVIQELINHFEASDKTTAFLNPENNFPEPLLTIYRRGSRIPIKSFIESQQKSPMYYLKSIDIQLVKSDEYSFLKNINTPEDYKKMLNAQS